MSFFLKCWFQALITEPRIKIIIITIKIIIIIKIMFMSTSDLKRKPLLLTLIQVFISTFNVYLYYRVNCLIFVKIGKIHFF